MTRYCQKCSASVEDKNGYCLLGHPLKVESAASSTLRELRAEVERAFEEAREEVAAALDESDALVPAGAPAEGLNDELSVSPVPAPPRRSIYEAIDGAAQHSDDPIAAFAPPPRMDWGPEKNRGLRRLRARLT